MDVSDYVTEKMAAARLEELRERSARLALLDQVRGGRGPLARSLGAALVRVGRWLAPDEVPDRNGGVRVARVR
ncbi:MAG TPA: hypothetical protein VMC04_23735 [Verrucomicrobiae bacterium]|jgi:hypothetical protein|nr:hypothetical protein [Verrucomicrobiae bacterium]